MPVPRAYYVAAIQLFAMLNLLYFHICTFRSNNNNNNNNNNNSIFFWCSLCRHSSKHQNQTCWHIYCSNTFTFQAVTRDLSTTTEKCERFTFADIQTTTLNSTGRAIFRLLRGKLFTLHLSKVTDWITVHKGSTETTFTLPALIPELCLQRFVSQWLACIPP